MKTLLVIKEQDIFPGAPEVAPTSFYGRKAVRAVVRDANGRIALLRLNHFATHKLPGGGVDEGEDLNAALQREILEEIGCEVEVTHEVGVVIEYRDQTQLFHTSYCYLANQVGALQPTALTEEEKKFEAEVVWVKNIDEAINIMKQDAPENYAGKFIQRRDLAFLQAAKSFMEPIVAK